MRAGPAAVLLIDELDRADDEFEAFLLEVLSDFAVTVPELGTISAAEPPAVVVTSNRTRELHDALKRRCLYHWIDFPDLEREVAIIRLRAPGVSEELARSVAGRWRGCAGWIWSSRRASPRRSTGRRRSRCSARRRWTVTPASRSDARLGREERRRPAARRVAPRAAPWLTASRGSSPFGRALRDEGLAVGPGAIVDFCRPRRCSRRRTSTGPDGSTLVARPDDIAVYDRVFHDFFGASPTRGASAGPAAARRRRRGGGGARQPRSSC